MVVGVLVAIDIVTLTAWQILDPFYRKTSLGVPVVWMPFMLLFSFSGCLLPPHISHFRTRET
jgi:hypothetical protein